MVVDSKETRRLFSADAAAVFAPPDYVLFHRQGALVAQRLDLRALKPVGESVLVSLQVAWNFSQLVTSVSASASGLLAYRTKDTEQQLVWFDRSAQQVGIVGGPDANRLGGMRLSPDGRTVALTRTVGGNVDIWLIETAAGVPYPFTLDANWNAARLGRPMEPR